MSNAFVHTELNTDNVAAAKKFYKAVFAWKLQDMPEMGYTMIDTGSKTSGGGMQKKPMAEAPNAWLPYVEVEDVKRSLAKAAKAGGGVVLDYTEIGGQGAIGIFIDPTGATLGVWQKLKPAKKAAKRPAKQTKKPAKKR